MLLLLAALVIGLSLGLFGSGGSILTVPVLMYLLGMPAALAIASSLLIVAAISLAGSVHNAWSGMISWRHVMWFGIPGMLGTYGGAWLGTLVDSRWQLLLFAVLMLIAAAFMWRTKPATPANNVVQFTAINYPKVIAEGLVVGAITGFVGVGGGFLIVPALVLLAGLPIVTAIATSLMIIALKSLVGFAKYYSVYHAQGQLFDWHAIAIIVLGGIAGSYFGGWLSQHLPKPILQRGFALFLLVMAAVVVSRSVL